MQITLLGITFHEFDVGATDLVLFVFCAYFFYRLLKSKTERDPLVIFVGLSLSSLCGALFHFFFPLKAGTPGGFLMWSLVAFSIGLVIFGALSYSLQYFFSQKRIHQLAPFLYVSVFMFFFFFINHTYPSIILFYAPSVAMLGVVAGTQLSKGKYRYGYLLSGVVLSFLAAIIQLARISIHDIYFNFNSLYHTVQLMGIFCMYIFFAKRIEGTRLSH